MKRVREIQNVVLNPTLVDHKNLVDSDVILKPLSENMFKEIPDIFPYNEDPEHNKELQSFDDMLAAFNVLLTEGPQWNTIANIVGLIGCPFNAILDWPTATASGYMFFLISKVNVCLQAMLKQWKVYLTSDVSIEVLHPLHGWLGNGLRPMLDKANDNGLNAKSHRTFTQTFECPDRNNMETYGFKN